MPRNQEENDFDIYYQAQGKRTYLASTRRGSHDIIDGGRSRSNTPNHYLQPTDYAQPRDQV